MLTRLKNWLCEYELADARDTKALYAELIKVHQERIASLTIVDLVREQLKGFNPRLLDTEDELMEILTDEESQDLFLQEVKKLADNTALPRILEHLIRNQVLYSAKEAKDLSAINFGRASINGCSLLREEVERLKTLYDERHKPEEDFDTHEAL